MPAIDTMFCYRNESASSLSRFEGNLKKYVTDGKPVP